MNKYEELLDQLNTLTAQVKDLIAGDVTEEEDGCSEIVEQLDDNLYCLSPVKGYCDHVDILCTVNDTGNGYIAHFFSHASHTQDNYICMDYAEADYLLKLLSFIKKGKV